MYRHRYSAAAEEIEFMYKEFMDKQFMTSLIIIFKNIVI